MRRMGIGKNEMSGHGFRAMARTILDKVLGFRPDPIEHQLDHAVRDPNGRAAPTTSAERPVQSNEDLADRYRTSGRGACWCLSVSRNLECRY